MFGVFRLIIMGFSLQHRGLHQQIHQLLMDQFKFIPYQFKPTRSTGAAMFNASEAAYKG
uniref:Uncharacterized protein n=1 Tax=Picea glauca TaxID=3330 RepID=A0A101LVG2_PICGL|nr:hypothetical protein ABT39_MTgene1905 [Picea glauca]